MGVVINKMSSYFEFSNENVLPEKTKQVYDLAEKSLNTFLLKEKLPNNLSHLIVSTTCPDFLAPSLGQMINEKFHSLFSNCQTIDLVQGCAGGITAMIIGSQLAEWNKSSVLIVQADAAKKATSKSKRIHKIFGNGSFVCSIEYVNSHQRLIHSKSKQYKGLSEVVTVKLGHDSDKIIKEKKDILSDPRKHLGLNMNNRLALKLLRQAEPFYLEFINESTSPDIMILHQVNPIIIKHLKSVFSKYPVEFIDFSEITGNCGSASLGVALDKIKDQLQGKKLFLCSFGTGGVITAGTWQC